MENIMLKRSSLSYGPYLLPVGMGLQTLLDTGHIFTQTSLIEFFSELIDVCPIMSSSWVVYQTTKHIVWYSILSLTTCLDMWHPQQQNCVLRVISKSFIWDQKIFPYRISFIHGGAPHKPDWATVSLQCGIDCPIPTDHCSASLGKF